jgi:predicted AlkP superfamily phosphohydrolase/phosphomutase
MTGDPSKSRFLTTKKLKRKLIETSSLRLENPNWWKLCTSRGKTAVVIFTPEKYVAHTVVIEECVKLRIPL